MKCALELSHVGSRSVLGKKKLLDQVVRGYLNQNGLDRSKYCTTLDLGSGTGVTDTDNIDVGST